MIHPVNPYIAGNPVTNPKMFFGREDIFAFIRQTLIGKYGNNMIILYGQQRSGKTSILYQMRSRMGSDYLCILIDLEVFTIASSSGFLWELARHTMRMLQRDYKIKLPPLTYDSFMQDPFGSFEHEFLARLWKELGSRHLLLMLDEVVLLEERMRTGKLEHDIFAYLRSLIQHHEQLDFILSLGSAIEGLKQESSNLFNIGLCKNISFLSIDATTDLITRPVTEYYQVDPAAIEHIRGLTSGHPYYTQLICHCIFNAWQQQQAPVVTAQDVDGILDEVVERGMAVLKHKWDESTLGEKAILVAMATAMEERIHGVSPEEINTIWQHYNIFIPSRVMVQSWQSLLQRELIGTPDVFPQQRMHETPPTPKMRSTYIFTVDLLRQWLQKYQRIEWVREEIMQKEPGWLRNKYTRRLIVGGLIGAGIVAATSSFWFLTTRSQPAPSRVYQPGETVREYREHTDAIWTLAWSPTNSNHIASAGKDHVAYVWDITSGELLHAYREHDEGITHLAWSPDGKYITSCGIDNSVRVWATDECYKYSYIQHQNDRGPEHAIVTTAWSPDGQLIASGGFGRDIDIWRARPDHTNVGQQLYRYAGHQAPIRTIAWSPDGATIASASTDKQVHIWQARNPYKLLSTFTLQHAPWRITWDRTNQHVTVLDRQGGLLSWDRKTNKIQHHLTGFPSAFKTLELSGDDSQIAMCQGNVVSTYTIQDDRIIEPHQYRQQQHEVNAVAWSLKEPLLASAGQDRVVRVWPYKAWTAPW